MTGFDDEPYGAVMYEKKKSQKLHQTARMDLPLIEIEEEDTEKGGKRNRNIGMWQGVRTGKKRGHKGQLYPLFSSKIFLLLQRERVENEVSGLLSQILILI